MWVRNEDFFGECDKAPAGFYEGEPPGDLEAIQGFAWVFCLLCLIVVLVKLVLYVRFKNRYVGKDFRDIVSDEDLYADEPPPPKPVVVKPPPPPPPKPEPVVVPPPEPVVESEPSEKPLLTRPHTFYPVTHPLEFEHAHTFAEGKGNAEYPIGWREATL
jgi:hypothetical protein